MSRVRIRSKSLFISDMSRKSSCAPGLSQEQLQEFEREGVLVIQDFLTQDEVREYLEPGMSTEST